MDLAKDYLTLSHSLTILHTLPMWDYWSGGWGFKSLLAHQWFNRLDFFQRLAEWPGVHICRKSVPVGIASEGSCIDSWTPRSRSRVRYSWRGKWPKTCVHLWRDSLLGWETVTKTVPGTVP